MERVLADDMSTTGDPNRLSNVNLFHINKGPTALMPTAVRYGRVGSNPRNSPGEKGFENKGPPFYY